MIKNNKNLRLIRPILLALILSVLPNFATPIIGQIVPPGARSLLKIGSQGQSVIELQAVLFLMGYYTGSINGIYAESTAQAVRKFQQDARLTVDGMAGTDTWNRLFPPSPIVAQPSVIAPQSTTVVAPATTNVNPPNTPNNFPTVATLPVQISSGDWQILRLGMEGSAVLGLQQRLTALGFYSGPNNGVFDSKTEAAVKAAQQKFNLPADGTVGPATWNALMQ